MAIPTVAWIHPYNDTVGGQTAHPMTFPSALTAGQVVVLFTSWDTNLTDSINATNFPGWTQLGTNANGTAVRGSCFIKVASGGETGVTVDLSVSELGAMIAYCCDGGDTPTGTSANGNSTNSDPPSHTHTGTADILWLVSRAGDAAVVATAAPTNYTNLQTLTGVASSASLNSAEFGVTADITEDPGTFTSATEQWVCFTVAVPAAAAGGSIQPPRTMHQRRMRAA